MRHGDLWPRSPSSRSRSCPIAAGAAWFGFPAAIVLKALVIAGFVAWMVASMRRPAVMEG